MTRPTYSPARSSRIELRCSAEQRTAWETAATADGRSLTGWIHRVLDCAIEPKTAVSEKTTRAVKKVTKRP